MQNFFDEVIKSCYSAVYEYSFARVLTSYDESLNDFETFEDSKRVAAIMACLPPYILQAMCFDDWGQKQHFEKMTASRRKCRQFILLQESDFAKVPLDSCIKTGKFGRRECFMVYRGANDTPRLCDQVKVFSRMKWAACDDLKYINIVLKARMTQLYIKIMELAIFMENNLQVKGSWLKFVALREAGRTGSDYMRKLTPIFDSVHSHEMTRHIFYSMMDLMSRKDQPIEKGGFRARSLTVEPTDALVVSQKVEMVAQDNVQPVKPQRPLPPPRNK